jgi:hypothetical protein
LKPLGLIFEAKKEYLDNLYILKKITKAMNNNSLLLSYKTEPN